MRTGQTELVHERRYIAQDPVIFKLQIKQFQERGTYTCVARSVH